MPAELDSMELLSLHIRNTRKAVGLSQKKLAKTLGMSQSTIARLEKDIIRLNPSYKTVYNVLEALQDASLRVDQSKILGKHAHEIMHNDIIFVKPGDTVEKAVKLMKDNDFAQIPVLNSQYGVLGTVTEKTLLKIVTESPETISTKKVGEILEPSLPQIDGGTAVAKIRPIMETFGAALVMNKGRVVGIITIYDIMKLL